MVHDRRLMREAQVNIAIRWFISFGLHEALPDHWSLTRVSSMLGQSLFERSLSGRKGLCGGQIVKGAVIYVGGAAHPGRRKLGSLPVRRADAVADANEDGTPNEIAARQANTRRFVHRSRRVHGDQRAQSSAGTSI